MSIFVRGGEICGHRKESTTFVMTGDRRGSYPVYVCNKPPHTSGKHHDSETHQSWY